MWPACFFPGASLAGEVCPFEDETADLVAAIDHTVAQLVFVRGAGGCSGDMKTVDSAATVKQREYSLCRLLYGLLCARTGIRPPWGMMTGVRPVRIIHDMRAEGADEGRHRGALFRKPTTAPPSALPPPAPSPTSSVRSWKPTARWIAASMRASRFCPTRCSYCSFVSRTVGDKAHPRARRALCRLSLPRTRRHRRGRQSLRPARAHAVHRRRHADKPFRRPAAPPDAADGRLFPAERHLRNTRSRPAAPTVPTKKSCASSKNTARPASRSTRRPSRTRCLKTSAAVTPRRIS